MIQSNRSFIKLTNAIRCYSSKLDVNFNNSVKSIFGNDNFALTESIRQHHSKDESLNQFSFFLRNILSLKIIL